MTNPEHEEQNQDQQPKTTKYSPSRINTFKKCRLQYKYRYIDRVPMKLETIEAFRGTTCHKALEEFYKLVKAGAVRPREWLLAKYDEVWEKEYTPEVAIRKKDISLEDFRAVGRKVLTDYYEHYKPFDAAKVVAMERGVTYNFECGGKAYRVGGIIDRLDFKDAENTFEVHDYKTSASLMTQEAADTDWQLGIYYLAVRELWPDASSIKLIWHMLLFNKEIVSTRTEAALDAFRADVAGAIDEIESAEEFPPTVSALCDWCDFQPICPEWKHIRAVEELPANEYKNDTGVELVAKYAALEKSKNEMAHEIEAIEIEQEKIKEAAVEFAEREGVTVIDGPGARLRIDTKRDLRAPTLKGAPEEWQALRDLLIKEGKYEEVSIVYSSKVAKRVRDRLWPPDLIAKVKGFLKEVVTKSVKLKWKDT